MTTTPTQAAEQGAGHTAGRASDTAGEAFGILNAAGDFWTHRTFADEREARDHIASFWRGVKIDLDQFTVIPVAVVVIDARAQGGAA